MTITYTPIGYGITDENGIAKLEYDAQGNPLTHSYTGTGAGKVDIVASLDNTITESSLVSEPYELIDAEWIYAGTDNTQASSWYNYNSLIAISYDDNGTTATTDGATTRYLYYNDSTVTTEKVGNFYAIPKNYMIEFDVTDITGSVSVYALDSSNTPKSKDLSETGHYKVIFNGEKLIVYKDGVEITDPSHPLTLSGNYIQFRFGFNATDESITFRDFIVYPI